VPDIHGTSLTLTFFPCAGPWFWYVVSVWCWESFKISLEFLLSPLVPGFGFSSRAGAIEKGTDPNKGHVHALLCPKSALSKLCFAQALLCPSCFALSKLCFAQALLCPSCFALSKLCFAQALLLTSLAN